MFNLSNQQDQTSTPTSSISPAASVARLDDLIRQNLAGMPASAVRDTSAPSSSMPPTPSNSAKRETPSVESTSTTALKKIKLEPNVFRSLSMQPVATHIDLDSSSEKNSRTSKDNTLEQDLEELMEQEMGNQDEEILGEMPQETPEIHNGEDISHYNTEDTEPEDKMDIDDECD